MNKLLTPRILRLVGIFTVAGLIFPNYVHAASPQASPPPASDPNVQASQVTFDSVLAMWTAGQKEQAVEAFLDLNWSRPDLFVSDSIFRISESQFTKLPEGKRAQIQQKAMEASKRIKELARGVVEQAKQTGTQAKCREALLSCANRLSANDQLALIQMVAKAAGSFAQKELP